MCSHPDCKARLVLEGSRHDNPALIGEAAHIIAAAPEGPRGKCLSPAELHSYDNLILLCRHHHALIDRQPGGHGLDVLFAWKAEHEAWVTAVTSVTGSVLPWTAIVQEEVPQTNVLEAQAALGPGHRVLRIEGLHSSCAGDGWTRAAADESRVVTSLVEHTPAERRRFAVFSTGRIPLAVQLGYRLGERVRVALFQYHRDQATWAWPPVQGPGRKSTLTGPRLRNTGKSTGDAILRVSLSARVDPKDTAEVVEGEVDIEIATAEPSVGWLRRPEQLAQLSSAFQKALRLVRERRTLQRIHLFYAGPAPGAICFGRAYNPTMNPALALYEYRHNARPRYQRVLELNSEPPRR
jgi:hypothetical protein